MPKHKHQYNLINFGLAGTLDSLDQRLAEAELNAVRNISAYLPDVDRTVLSSNAPNKDLFDSYLDHISPISNASIEDQTLTMDHLDNSRAERSQIAGKVKAKDTSKIFKLFISGIPGEPTTEVFKIEAAAYPIISVPKLEENLTASAASKKMDRKLRQNKPRLLLMGQRRSGKSSITSVVFHKMPPQETLFLESTTRIQKDSMHSFMDFQVWDFPGQLDYFDPTFDTTEIFSEIGALVWVIDAQDDYSESLNRLTTTILNLQTTFPHINVEVFVHKIDSLNEEFKNDIFQDIVQRVGDELSDAGYINPNVSYHLTSIYDYSIFEAFSKVIQKLIPQHDTLENLLNILVNNCGMAKAYLFDILSKIYIASDSRPIDMEVYEMCSDYIDVIVDITDLYNYPRSNTKILGEQMEEAESSVTIHDGTMIYLKEMNKYLCLVTVIKHDQAKDKKGLIDYNCHIFQDALNAVFARDWEKDKQVTSTAVANGESSVSGIQSRLEAQLK